MHNVDIPFLLCDLDDSPGAVDVAADIVTSAMTDALRQAAESPVDPETRQLSVHPVQHSCSQYHHPPHSLSSHQPQQQHFSCKSRDHLQHADTVENLSSAREFAAETAHIEQNSACSAVTYSGSTAQSKDYTALHSSSSEANVPVARSLQSLSSVSCTSAPSATTSTVCPQIAVHSSDSLIAQQPGTVGLSEGKCQELSTQLSTVECLTHSSPIAGSDRASGNRNDLAAAAEFSAFIRASGHLPSLQADSGSEEKLAYNVLGNLSKLKTPSSAGVLVEPEFAEAGEHHDVLHSPEQHEMSQLPERHAGSPSRGNSDDGKDIVIELPMTSNTCAVFSSASSCMDTERTKVDEPAFSQNVRSVTDDKYEDIVNSIDVVLSLPALQAEFERMSSGLSSSSLAVNVDSQSVSANSAEEESIRLNTEVLYVNVDSNALPVGTWSHNRNKSDGRASSIESVLLEPPFSSSPQSSVSSANVSPNTSFLVSEPFHREAANRSSEVHAVADFFIPGLEGLSGQARQSARRESRDFYGELRDFLSSSSSGSRGSGSAGPLSSTNSSWGSRSGSLSSHGTNGSTIDFPEFWSNFRRRSSQMSDTTSRRSSSSKHSTDFSTDLEVG